MRTGQPRSAACLPVGGRMGAEWEQGLGIVRTGRSWVPPLDRERQGLSLRARERSYPSLAVLPESGD